MFVNVFRDGVVSRNCFVLRTAQTRGGKDAKPCLYVGH